MSKVTVASLAETVAALTAQIEALNARLDKAAVVVGELRRMTPRREPVQHAPTERISRAFFDAALEALRGEEEERGGTQRFFARAAILERAHQMAHPLALPAKAAQDESAE